MERKKRGSERERWGEYERERDKWGSEWVSERGRLLKRDRERERERERETDVPKLYAYNECEHSVILRHHELERYRIRIYYYSFRVSTLYFKEKNQNL